MHLEGVSTKLIRGEKRQVEKVKKKKKEKRKKGRSKRKEEQRRKGEEDLKEKVLLEGRMVFMSIAIWCST